MEAKAVALRDDTTIGKKQIPEGVEDRTTIITTTRTKTTRTIRVEIITKAGEAVAAVDAATKTAAEVVKYRGLKGLRPGKKLFCSIRVDRATRMPNVRSSVAPWRRSCPAG